MATVTCPRGPNDPVGTPEARDARIRVPHDGHASRNEGAERILIVSDIHSNIEALEACLPDARARGGFTRCWNIGDTVGYGPDPVGVLDGLNRIELPAITTGSKAEFARKTNYGLAASGSHACP